MRLIPTTLILALAGALVPTLLADDARASGPTTAECLAASEASLKAATDHQLREERSQLVVCASASCPGAIRKECLARVDEVNRQLPTIIFAAKDASGADVTAVKVTMDGQPLADRLDGSPLTVDPGPHVFTFDSAALRRVQKSLVIEQSQKDRRELVALAAPVASKPASAVVTEQTGLGTQRTLAIAAAAVGVVGLILGGVFGGLAVSEKSSAQGACPSATCATMAGSSDWTTAGTFGTVSTVGFIVGGVGVAGAAALWFTAPKSAGQVSAQIELAPLGLRVTGTW